MFVGGRKRHCHKQGCSLLGVKDSAPQIKYLSRDKSTRNLTALTPSCRVFLGSW